MTTTTQIIFNGNEYAESCTCDRAERPEWPVQDQGAHWHHEEFDGQMVVYRTSEVYFGFMAEKVPEQDVPRDEDGEMDLDDLFLCDNGEIYRAKSENVEPYQLRDMQ